MYRETALLSISSIDDTIYGSDHPITWSLQACDAKTIVKIHTVKQ